MIDFHKQTTQPDLTSGSAHFHPPEAIGPYTIERELSRGGMSILYLASNPTREKRVVIKVLLPKFLKNKELANRFIKEAEIIGMTKHPNIVKLYDQGGWKKGLYIAMEYIEGASLREYIEKQPVTEKRALEIIQQVAFALCHLHAHGVIHRDLKPENIIITETGEIKVIDFGISEHQSDPKKERITQKKRLMGTPIYMSPEQKENPSEVSFTSDVYALGIISYELLIGRLSRGVIHLDLLPHPLRKIVGKALRPNKLDRYQEMIDFLTDISEYIGRMDEPKEEAQGELLELIQGAHHILVPPKPPHLPELEIGLATHLQSYCPLYVDFFQLPQNKSCILILEPTKNQSGSFAQMAVIKGMIRALFQENKHPIQIVNAINLALLNDPIRYKFILKLLLLDPKKEQLTFLSLGSSDLIYQPQKTNSVEILKTPNPPLGEMKTPTFLETVGYWGVDDRLVLSSSNMDSSQKDLLHAKESKLPMQTLSEKMILSIREKRARSTNRGAVVITLRSKYKCHINF